MSRRRAKFPAKSPTAQRTAGQQSLPEHIAGRISEAILSGALQPYHRIREQELSDAFGVSRGPIREALRILEKDGVIRISPGRGAHVTALSIDEVDQIFEIREALHGLLARKLCERPHPDVIAKAEERVAYLHKISGDPSALDDHVKSSLELLLTLARASGNERLSQMLESITRQILRYTQLGLSIPGRRAQSAANWRNVIQALKDRNTERASHYLRKLSEDSRLTVIKLLSERGEAKEPRIPSKRVVRSNRGRSKSAAQRPDWPALSKVIRLQS